jgi:hypothetical protein
MLSMFNIREFDIEIVQKSCMLIQQVGIEMVLADCKIVSMNWQIVTNIRLHGSHSLVERIIPQ